ncbi:MAG: arsenate reductase ArsC [Mangrovibacterium sp.]
MKKVLILCTGNSCRSQMAHGFLQKISPETTVCSAGTKAAGKINTGAQKAMAEVGIDISTHSSDSVDIYLNQAWDYVITVCGGANETCPTFIGEVKNRLHIGFDDPSHAVGTPEFIEREFRRVRDEIKDKMIEFNLTELSK